uniref:ABC transporter permease n=1 Tax=Mesocestoides corti TaxID=53468 RepID=A0A5K3G1A5_MESCO
MYAVNRKLGPKSVMIFHMLVELAVFLLILLIFLVPYGISTQAMLFPYVTEFNAEMVKAVFYYPYYRLYGELFLEESEGMWKSANRIRVFADMTIAVQPMRNSANYIEVPMW